jgi:two-component system chemotaxis response regulator CheY
MIELNNLNVFLVEPSRLQAKIITNYLEEIGVEHIARAVRGDEALDALESNTPPDVIISSLYLPDMTGTELVLHIRQSENHSDTPFVLISSETNPRNLEGIRQAGTTAILPKPFTQPQLLHAVQSILDFLNAEEENEELSDLKLIAQKVLIVDDSKVSRRHIRQVLERIGFEDFTEAVDGKEAIPLIDSVLFDLVVTDYNMPNIDGLALVDYIRTKSIQSSVPILMVTSEQEEERLATVMNAGVSAICDKPFETSLVRNLVRQFISGEENG